MFGIFRRKAAEPIVFESPSAAFGYACRELENRILLEAVVPALVEERGRIGVEGERYFRIRLADHEGGRSIEACTLKESAGFPEVGDLVGYKVLTYDPDLPEPFALLGFIAYGLEPVYVPARGWRISCIYVPDTIKPTLRM